MIKKGRQQLTEQLMLLMWLLKVAQPKQKVKLHGTVWTYAGEVLKDGQLLEATQGGPTSSIYTHAV